MTPRKTIIQFAAAAAMAIVPAFAGCSHVEETHPARARPRELALLWDTLSKETNADWTAERREYGEREVRESARDVVASDQVEKALRDLHGGGALILTSRTEPLDGQVVVMVLEFESEASADQFLEFSAGLQSSLDRGLYREQMKLIDATYGTVSLSGFRGSLDAHRTVSLSGRIERLRDTSLVIGRFVCRFMGNAVELDRRLERFADLTATCLSQE